MINVLDRTVFEDFIEYLEREDSDSLLLSTPIETYLISFLITDNQFGTQLMIGSQAKTNLYAYRYDEYKLGIDKGFEMKQLSRIENYVEELISVANFDETASLALLTNGFEKFGILLIDIDGDYETSKNAISHIHSDGFVVIWDYTKNNLIELHEELKKTKYAIYESGNFVIFHNKIQYYEPKEVFLANKLKSIYNRTYKLLTKKTYDIPHVCVGIIAYQQEKYIIECLKSIVKQEGNFKLHVVVFDDCSKDNTSEKALEYLSSVNKENYSFEVIKQPQNIGLVLNYKRCFNYCSSYDFIGTCDGDDYWCDNFKIQKHLEFLKNNPRCIGSFDTLCLYWQDENRYESSDLEYCTKKSYMGIYQLIANNTIGTFSACFYRREAMLNLPDSLFNMFTVDWMFNLNAQKLGDLGHVKEIMTVYRKHGAGAWSGVSKEESSIKLADLINQYNEYFDFIFDAEFTHYQNKFCNYPKYDLVIIDDSFPSIISGFRYQEYVYYLENIKNSIIYCTEGAYWFFGDATYKELAPEFKRQNPTLATKITRNEWLFCEAKLFYFVFLNNVYKYIDIVESQNVPFVFTLYPGGGLAFDNPVQDDKLRRVLSSPCFKRVIVTQKIVYDYLIKNEFCKRNQIELIFGVVTPSKIINKDCCKKLWFGKDKDTLDICFVARRYTVSGIDKGYDIFIDVAKKLCCNFNNIYFHVVGGYDETIFDISEIKDKIKFYGEKTLDWFEEFYIDKDIILSPNIDGIIAQGAFDGFPTGCSVDAAFHKTAIFCTDELGQNNGFFEDKKELVIVPYDSIEIVNIISKYYLQPQKIIDLGENGYKKVKELYSLNAQMRPRINLLNEMIFESEGTKQKKWLKIIDSVNDVQDSVFFLSHSNKVDSHESRFLISKLKNFLGSNYNKIYERVYLKLPACVKINLKKIIIYFNNKQ